MHGTRWDISRAFVYGVDCWIYWGKLKIDQKMAKRVVYRVKIEDK